MTKRTLGSSICAVLMIGLAGCGYTPCENLLPATINEDTTISECALVDRTVVAGGATLTVEPGTRVEFLPDGFLHVNRDQSGANLIAVAKPSEETIAFTSAQGPAAEPGDWQCVRIDKGAFRTLFEGVEFEWGGAPCEATGHSREAMLVVNSEILGVYRSDFRVSAGHGILLENDAWIVNGISESSFGSNRLPSIRMGLNSVYATGTGNTYFDADDYIAVDTTPNLDTPGNWRPQPVPYRLLAGARGVVEALVTDFGDRDSIPPNPPNPVYIAAGTVIELESGTIEFRSRTVEVKGTEEKPVVFTSAAEDPAPGAWGCIWARASPEGRPISIDHARVEFAGSGDLCGGGLRLQTGIVADRSVSVTNTTFENISGAAYIVTDESCPEVRYPADHRLCAGNEFLSEAAAEIGCGPAHIGDVTECAEE